MAGFIFKIKNRRQRDFTDDVPGGERPRYDADTGGSFAPAGSPRPEKAANIGRRGSLRGASETEPDKPGSAPRAAAYSAGGSAPKADPYQQPKGNTLPKSEPDGAEPETDTGEGADTDAGSSEYDPGAAISEFYNRLYQRLRAYGITDIPSFNELYGLFESFLRPSIDAAIAQRQRTGRANKAELDADAYARGMGGSSYISSMKARENANAAADISALEGKYSASMAEYLYKALETMQKIEGELAKARMTLAGRYSSSSGGRTGSSGSHGSHGSHGSDTGASEGDASEEGAAMPYGHNKNGSYFDGVWYDGDFSYLDKDYTYVDYARYLKGLSPAERYLFFTSNDREWRIRRWQVQYNLPQVDYWDLYNAYMPQTGAVGDGHHDPGYGGNLWQPVQY